MNIGAFRIVNMIYGEEGEIFNVWNDKDFIDKIKIKNKLNADGYGVICIGRTEIEELENLVNNEEIKNTRTVEIIAMIKSFMDTTKENYIYFACY